MAPGLRSTEVGTTPAQPLAQGCGRTPSRVVLHAIAHPSACSPHCRGAAPPARRRRVSNRRPPLELLPLRARVGTDTFSCPPPPPSPPHSTMSQGGDATPRLARALFGASPGLAGRPHTPGAGRNRTAPSTPQSRRGVRVHGTPIRATTPLDARNAAEAAKADTPRRATTPLARGTPSGVRAKTPVTPPAWCVLCVCVLCVCVRACPSCSLVVCVPPSLPALHVLSCLQLSQTKCCGLTVLTCACCVCDGVLRVPDNSVSECMACDAEFGFFRRRHHCRACGKVYCDNCSRYRSPIPLYGIKVRNHCRGSVCIVLLRAWCMGEESLAPHHAAM